MLKNIGVAYDPVEDRIVLRLTLQADEEGEAVPAAQGIHDAQVGEPDGAQGVTQRAAEAGIATVEHALHLTRRVCAALRPDLQAMLDLSAELPAHMDRAAKAAVSSAHHQAMASQVPMRTEPAPGPPPARARPRLVRQAVCGRRRSDRRWVLRFEFEEGQPLSMLLSGTTLHALAGALAKRVQAAQWGLPPLPHERQSADPPRATGLH
jgi:hypothetical protein